MTSTSRRYCSCSTVFSRNLCLSPRPALFTSRSTGRAGSASRASTGASAARSPRSATRTSASTPYRSRSSAASFSRRSWLRETSTRSCPDAASWWAKERPMPEVGPVTRAVGRDMPSSIPGRTTPPQHGSGMMGLVPATKTRVLAVANQKGGVAKTTTVASLGAALAELGQRVLLVDLDPQACLTFSLGIDPEDLELSVHHVLTKGLDATEVILETDDGVDLLPATIELARAEADLLTRTGREHVVKMAIEDLDYDWVLLDCPPSLGVLTVAALTAAHGRADPAAVRDPVAPRRRPAARHRARRTPLHQPQARGLGRAADAVRRAHEPRPRGAREHLRDLPARRHRAADPEVDPVRRGAGRRPVDPRHHPHAPRRRGLPRRRGGPHATSGGERRYSGAHGTPP